MSEPIVIDAHGRHAQAVCFTKDSKHLFSAGQDACIRVWKAPSFAPERAIEGHGKSVNSLAFAPGEKLLASGSTDGTVRVWSFPEGECRHVLQKQVSGVFAPDGQVLATISAKSRIVLWDVKTGAEIATLPELDKRLLALAYAPDGRKLFVGGTGPIHVVALPAGKVGRALEGHTVLAAALRVSPDGKLLASTGGDGNLRLWTLSDLSLARTIALRGSGVMQIAFAPDGDQIAVSIDGAILVCSLKRLSSIKKGAVVEHLDVPVKGVYGVAWSPDGRWIANAAADGKVRVWKRA